MNPQTKKQKNKCCVPGCTNLAAKIHRFPREPDLCKRWVNNIKLPRLQELTPDQIYWTYYVCDVHFAKKYVVPGILRGLRKDAIPTLHLSLMPKTVEVIEEYGQDVYGSPKTSTSTHPSTSMEPSVPCYPCFQKDSEIVLPSQICYVVQEVAIMEALSLSVTGGQNPQGRKSAIYITEKPEDESNLQMVEEAEILHNLHLFDAKFIDVPETDLPISYSSDISTVVEDPNTLASQPYRIRVHNTDKQNLETDASLLSVQDECDSSPVMTNSSVVASVLKSTAGDKVILDTNHILESENVKIQNLQIDHEEEVVFDSEVPDPLVEDVEESFNSPCSTFGEKALSKTPLTKPYFRSVKSYLKDCDRMTEVCRICFCSLDDKEVIKLYEDTPQQDSTQIKNMLKLVLPDLDLEIYPNSVICTKCVELLLYSYQFKEKWLLTEEKLQKLIEKKKGVISSAADLVIIGKLLIDKKTQSCGDIVDNDDAYTAQPHLDERTRKNMTDSILENLLQHKEKSAPVSVFYGELDLNNKNKNNIQQKAYQSLQQKNIIRREKKMYRKSVGPFMCEQCGHMVMSLRSLKRHLMNHANPKERNKKRLMERKFMCEICGQLFTTPNNLQRHASKHAEYTCSFCNRIFNHQFQLQNHIKSKHIRNCYQCHLCGKQMSYARSLQLHMQLHYPKPKRQVCHICDKRFRYPCNLRKHLRSHVREKLLRCEHCGRLLKHEVSLRKHIEIYHMNQGRNVCEFCNKPYWKKCDLDKHKIRCQGGGFAIEECVKQNHDEVIFNEDIDPNNESCYVEYED